MVSLDFRLFHAVETDDLYSLGSVFRTDDFVQKCSHSEQKQGEVATNQFSTSKWSVSLFTLCHLVLIFCGQVDDLPRSTASTKGQGVHVLQAGEGDTNQITTLFHFDQV